MKRVRTWSSVAIATLVALSVLVGAGPTQAGEACPKNLRLPTPKSLGLGSGWKGLFAVNEDLKYVKPKDCRYATQCMFVIWMSERKPYDGAILAISAYEASKREGKQLVAMTIAEFKEIAEPKYKIRRGKTLTFAVKGTDKGTNPPISYSNSISLYDNKRVASIGMSSYGSLGNRYQQLLPLNKMIKKTQQMTKPCSGKMSQLHEIKPLKKVRNLTFRNFGAWSMIR